jgi:hypothetical protein
MCHFSPAIYVGDEDWIDPESIEDIEADFTDIQGGYVRTFDAFHRRWALAVFPAAFKPEVIAIMTKRLAAKKAYDDTMDLVDELNRRKNHL